MTTQRFLIELGHDDETCVYLANVISTLDNKGTSVESPNLKLVLAQVSKTIRKRERHNRCFPPTAPEPSLIIDPSNDRGPQLIVPARN